MVDTKQKQGIGLFHTEQEAEQALNELKASGFPMERVSILAKQAEEGEQLAGAQMSDRIGDQDIGETTGVVGDIATTSALGTALLGLGSLAIPGVGPVIAAGSLGATLAATITGVGLGAAKTNHLIHTLADLGVPEEQARVYLDRLVKADYLVLVEGTEDEIQQAEASLQEQGIQAWGVY